MTITLSVNKLPVAAICSIITITTASSADAVTFSVGEIGQLTSIEPGATTVDFESGAPTTGNAIYSGSGQVVTGNLSGQYAKPYRLPDNTPYLTIGENQATTINFAKPLTYFGLYFGSADTYNNLEFFNDNERVSSFTGAILLGSGAQDQDNTNRYVNFLAQGEETFDRVVLSSSQFAFETDNHAYKVVPEPSSALGVLAFGALGTGSLLKRKLKQKART